MTNPQSAYLSVCPLRSRNVFAKRKTLKHRFDQSFKYFLLLFLICTGSAAFAQLPSYNQTVSSLWSEYVSNPYNHPNIPNNSYAGYGTGLIAIPSPSTTAINVTKAPYNAIPNDNINDQPAIQAAIDAAGAAGGGIVYLPAGTYRLHKPLFIKYSNVIVRGQGSVGSTATILDFKFSMYSMYKADIDASNNKGCLWWSTGLVWMGPHDAFKTNDAPNLAGGFEDWKSSATLTTVTQVSNPGSFSITVGSAALLSPGMKIVMRYRMPSNRSFIKHVYGHSATASSIDNNTYVGDCSDVKYPEMPSYYYPAVIKSISGNTVTFDRPLRIKVDPSLWPVDIRNIKSIVTESGLENVQIKGYNTSKMGHLVTPTSTTTAGSPTLGGWNGLYINRSWNCWANNVRFVNLECGVLFANAKNCSVLNSFATSTSYDHWYHHPYAFRSYSSDNLVENFTIDGPSAVRHGISAERFSSGNVYSKGLMKVGTFDSHRGLPFDLIKTEITVANDASSSQGGASGAGPYSGKRNVNWNIIQKIQSGYTYDCSISRKGDNIYEPLQYPMGAFVGITATMDCSNGEFLPPPPSGGDIGSKVVTASITDYALFNLYHAELALRKNGVIGSTPAATTVKITSPASNTAYTAPAIISITAEASNTDGISKVEFYNGSNLLCTDYTAPYECSLDNAPEGTHALTAKATTSKGTVTTSNIVYFSVVTEEANIAPTVSIASPAIGDAFNAPANVNISAAATDVDGSITKVDFYNKTTYLGTDYTSPYSFTWNGVSEGNYSVTAEATDNDGKVTTSAAVIFSAAVSTATSNEPPAVSITSPVTNDIFNAPADVLISATATDGDGSITKVDFYNKTTFLGTDYTSPYSFNWHGVSAGNYAFTATATDNDGSVSTSDIVYLSVTNEATLSSNIAPTVSITSPANSASYPIGKGVYLSADAKDADGTIQKVDFYDGSTLIFTENVIPYRKYYRVHEGTYSITAKATDNEGKVTTSAPITISGTSSTMAKSMFNSSEETLGLMSLNVSPNPAAKTLNISIQGLQTNNGSSISVLSVSGAVIKTIQPGTSNKNVQVDVSSLSGGVYFIKVINGDKVLYKQFVKQ